MDGCKNCDGAGAAQPKTGKNRQALSRAAGMAATSGALGSKTRSRYPASSTNNLWQAAPTGYGSNENIKGYGS
jgi:hypothetical protein